MTNTDTVRNVVVFAIDPGEKTSGVAIIMLSSNLDDLVQLIGFNVDNALVHDKIMKYYVKYDLWVVMEDVVPYRQHLSANLINTCKYIGELNYRLVTAANIPVEYVSRGKVKKWVFDAFPAMCVDRIGKKIEYLDDYGKANGKRRYRNKDGALKKSTFHWVDDRVVIAAMKIRWNIPTPKPGRKSEGGFSAHSWQALAVGSYFLSSKFGKELFKPSESHGLTLF